LRLDRAELLSRARKNARSRQKGASQCWPGQYPLAVCCPEQRSLDRPTFLPANLLRRHPYSRFPSKRCQFCEAREWLATYRDFSGHEEVVSHAIRSSVTTGHVGGPDRGTERLERIARDSIIEISRALGHPSAGSAAGE